jgi:hypothetical protein
MDVDDFGHDAEFAKRGRIYFGLRSLISAVLLERDAPRAVLHAPDDDTGLIRVARPHGFLLAGRNFFRLDARRAQKLAKVADPVHYDAAYDDERKKLALLTPAPKCLRGLPDGRCGARGRDVIVIVEAV